MTLTTFKINTYVKRGEGGCNAAECLADDSQQIVIGGFSLFDWSLLRTKILDGRVFAWKEPILEAPWKNYKHCKPPRDKVALFRWRRAEKARSCG